MIGCPHRRNILVSRPCVPRQVVYVVTLTVSSMGSAVNMLSTLVICVASDVTPSTKGCDSVVSWCSRFSSCNFHRTPPPAQTPGDIRTCSADVVRWQTRQLFGNCVSLSHDMLLIPQAALRAKRVFIPDAKWSPLTFLTLTHEVRKHFRAPIAPTCALQSSTSVLSRDVAPLERDLHSNNDSLCNTALTSLGLPPAYPSKLRLPAWSLCFDCLKRFSRLTLPEASFGKAHPEH